MDLGGKIKWLEISTAFYSVLTPPQGGGGRKKKKKKGFMNHGMERGKGPREQGD